MNAEVGCTVTLPGAAGADLTYQVTAIRHHPIDFVELQPRDGGPKRTVRLSELTAAQVTAGPIPHPAADDPSTK